MCLTTRIILLYNRHTNKTKGLKMTLKELINKYFDERVVVSDSGYHCYDSFLNVWADLIGGIRDYGIEGAFPAWADEHPTELVLDYVTIVDNYINNTLAPKYRKWSTITK